MFLRHPDWQECQLPQQHVRLAALLQHVVRGLFITPPQLAVRHPFLWVYGAIISILFVPLRWTGIVHPDAALAATLVFYLAVVVFIHRRNFDWYVLLMPFYTLISNMILIPLGVVSYLEMAFKHRNVGLIRLNRINPIPRPPN